MGLLHPCLLSPQDTPRLPTLAGAEKRGSGGLWFDNSLLPSESVSQFLSERHLLGAHPGTPLGVLQPGGPTALGLPAPLAPSRCELGFRSPSWRSCHSQQQIPKDSRARPEPGTGVPKRKVTASPEEGEGHRQKTKETWAGRGDRREGRGGKRKGSGAGAEVGVGPSRPESPCCPMDGEKETVLGASCCHMMSLLPTRPALPMLYISPGSPEHR